MSVLERQKIGGIVALIEAATFVFGFAMAASVLSDYTTGDPDPGESVAFVAGNQAALGIWYAVILIAFGVLLVPLVLALHERLKSGSPAVVQMATTFGFIWAGLVVAAGMIAIIGLGTVADLYDIDPERAEPVWSALDSVQNGLGGGNEIVPALEVIGAVFGLGLVVWFIWVGSIMLSDSSHATRPSDDLETSR